MNDSKYSNIDYELSRKMLTLLKGGYPARLKKALIVTAPLWFKAPFNLLRLFAREKLRDRAYNVPSHHSQPYNIHHIQGNLSSWLLNCLSSPILPPHMRDNSCSEEGNSSVKQKSSSGDDNSSVNSSSGDDNSSVNSSSGDDNSSVNFSSGDDGGDWLHSDQSGGETIEEFHRNLQRKGTRGLYEEYANIRTRRPEGTFISSRLRCNRSKNRFHDVLCYDHSRVKLSRNDSDPRSDYIHANFIDGYCQKNAFISTQGPWPEIFPDFWQMVWESQVGVIVMITRTIEEDKWDTSWGKCGQYWPWRRKTKKTFGHYLVSNDRVDTFTDYIITNLNVTDTRTNQTKKVSHIEFRAWPSYGVPYSAVAMLGLRDKVREIQKEYVMANRWKTGAGPPILLHCSQGCGRTGTYIALDISICRLEATGLIDVRSTVEKIRSQRAHSVQTPNQYVICHLGMLEYALSRGLLQKDQVDLSEFRVSDHWSYNRKEGIYDRIEFLDHDLQETDSDYERWLDEQSNAMSVPRAYKRQFEAIKIR